jgi:hypothetical protein
MNIFQAKVTSKDDWWELRLVDLNIVSDGSSEDEMLRQLEHALMAEYSLALRDRRTPFVGLRKNNKPPQNSDGSGSCMRLLNLPDPVRTALSAALNLPSLISEVDIGGTERIIAA